jgi:ring-1,2-phenylacetyl-CoA epoxidase subunit PaaD
VTSPDAASAAENGRDTSENGRVSSENGRDTSENGSVSSENGRDTSENGRDARTVASAVRDPELPFLTIADLGILRDVVEDSTGVRVTIIPTYSGCPALDLIRSDIVAALAGAGYPDARVDIVLRPAWSTDLITEVGLGKLAAAGIAPPRQLTGAAPDQRVFVALSPRRGVRCPRCGGTQTQELSRFGSTACTAVWRCESCGEPFQQVKPL